ncbi:MMPL family transporter, partial [Candidatus Poribacteria bacterium]|nr:MMPL family transporter [Candidatus Poribacteria bacterium]
MSIGKFSIKNPVLINLIMLTILVVGAYSYLSLPREVSPEIPFNWVFVTTIYPGASPEEIEYLITKPIEEEIEDIENIDLITSTSAESASFISVKFQQNISEREFDKRFQDLNSAVDKVILPDGAEDPDVTELSTSVWLPVVSVVISGDLPEKELKKIAEELESSIKQVEGISQVTLAGVRDREIWVEVDQDRMESLNITFNQIVNSMNMQNLNIPGGNIRSGRSEYIVRTLGQFGDVEDIKNVIVHTYQNGNHLRIRDVADVSDTFEEATTLARFNGRSAVTLNIIKKAGANTIGMVKETKEVVKDYETVKLPAGAYIDITNDMSVYIKKSLGTLSRNALFGVILVLLSLGVFLGARNGLFVAIGMPVTFMATFIFMKITGQTINGNSLFGLVLVLGMVVDHAIVITENVYRHSRMRNKSIYQAVIDGMAEVTTPVLSATATTIAAFLPLMLMPGIVGAFMRTIPMIVTMALLASLFEALIILPSHIAEWTPPKNQKDKKQRWVSRIINRILPSRIPKTEKTNGNGKFLKKIIKGYSRILKHILRRRYWAVGGVILCVAGGIGLIPLIGVDMFGEEDVGSFYVRLWMPPGTRISETSRVLKQVEDIALSLPKDELKAVIA